MNEEVLGLMRREEARKLAGIDDRVKSLEEWRADLVKSSKKPH